LSLLDQAIAYGAGAVRATEVRTMLGTIERGQVYALLEAAHAGDGARLLGEIEHLAEFSPDFAGVLDEIAGALHRVQLKQLVQTQASEAGSADAPIATLAAEMPAEEVQLFYQIAITGRRDLPLAPTPRAGFEMTLLRMLAFRPAESGAQTSKPATPVRTIAPANIASRSAAERASPQVTPPAQPSAAAPALMSSPPSDWAGMIAAADLKGPAGQLARNASLIAIDGGVVRLALDPAHEHMVAAPVVANIEQRLGAVLGQSIKLKFEKPGAAHDTPAVTAQRERDMRQQEAERALGEDPFVQAVIRDFGGRVVPESIKPAATK
jgi:DNA polymerase-3 subunit gamma/tau